MKLSAVSEFDEFDRKHYEMENKLLALVKYLQIKPWDNKIHESNNNYSTTP